MRKLPDDVLEDLRAAYEDEAVPITEIARWAGCSRTSVYKFFRKHGVETRKGVATRREVKCETCGKVFSTTRSQYRKNKRHFCHRGCYDVYLESRDTSMNRHKQRIAREKVSAVFDLRPEHVVHHKDSDHFNTSADNFLVFANQSDHMKYHHQLRQGEVTVKPIWDGAGHNGELHLEAVKDEIDLLAADAALKAERKKKGIKEAAWVGSYSKDRQLGKKGRNKNFKN